MSKSSPLRAMRARPADRPTRIDLRPGDEVVTTNQDYGRMLDTWEQRVRRDRIRLTKIRFPCLRHRSMISRTV